jgi:predicted chitinase
MNIQNFVNNLNINKVAQLQILNIVAKYNINSKLRLAHFVSQTASESLNFTTRVENLNYSANNLLTTFYNYFNSDGILGDVNF